MLPYFLKVDVLIKFYSFSECRKTFFLAFVAFPKVYKVKLIMYCKSSKHSLNVACSVEEILDIN